MSCHLLETLPFDVPGPEATRRIGDLAAIHGISTVWAGKLQVWSAWVYFRLQLSFLGHVTRMCEQIKPGFIASRLAWDETGQRVTTQFEGTSATQACSTWQVMVCRLRLLVGWPAQGKVLDLSIALPPFLVTKATADQIYSVLFHHPVMQPVFAARALLYSRAELVFDLDETDGAYANDRVEAHLLSKDRPAHVYHDHFRCRLHQQQLVETGLLAVAGANVLSRLYSLSLLLRSGAYFVKLIGSLSHVVPKNLVIRDVAVMGGPLPEAVAYQRELFSYMLVHRKRFQHSQEKAANRADAAEGNDGSESEGDAAVQALEGRLNFSAKAKGLRQFVADLKEMGDVFNGPFWEDGPCSV